MLSSKRLGEALLCHIKRIHLTLEAPEHGLFQVFLVLRCLICLLLTSLPRQSARMPKSCTPTAREREVYRCVLELIFLESTGTDRSADISSLLKLRRPQSIGLVDNVKTPRSRLQIPSSLRLHSLELIDCTRREASLHCLQEIPNSYLPKRLLDYICKKTMMLMSLYG